MECRRGEGISMECQRVDEKEHVWNVRELMWKNRYRMSELM